MDSEGNGAPNVPLAEGRWLWRRVYVFGFSLGVWLLLERTLARIAQADLPRMAEALTAVQALTVILYLMAPSAQQIVAVIAQLRLRVTAGGGA